MEHHLDFMNPAEQKIHEDDLPRTELEEALQSAWKEKTKRWALEQKVSSAMVKLELLRDLFSTLEDKDLYENKVKEIINDLK